MDPFTAALVQQEMARRQQMQALMTQAPQPLAIGGAPMPQQPLAPYALPGGPAPQPQPYSLPGGPAPANDWTVTGIMGYDGGRPIYDANNINASDPGAAQWARHLMTDEAGQADEGQNSSDAQSNMDLASQNQAETGYYGYGSI